MTGTSTKKTYTPLSQISGGEKIITKCGALLPNRMQCWRAGDVLCETEELVVSDDPNTENTKRVTSTQYCYAHARMMQEQDISSAKAAEEVLATETKPVPEASTDKPQPKAEEPKKEEAPATPAPKAQGAVTGAPALKTPQK